MVCYTSHKSSTKKGIKESTIELNEINYLFPRNEKTSSSYSINSIHNFPLSQISRRFSEKLVGIGDLALIEDVVHPIAEF